MRIFMALLTTETNTFAPLPTGLACFVEGGLAHGDASSRPESTIGVLVAEWRRLAEADGHTVIEGLAANAQPGGRTVRSVYESFRDQIVSGARDARPDIVLLSLHGAMAADGYDDCEGDLLHHLRAALGPNVIIGAELDLHCHLTDKMVENATALIAFKEYPHTDELERGRELYDLCRDAALGHVRPVTAVFDCRMIGLWRTTTAPMRDFIRQMQDREGHDGVLSISFGHGFPWADVADAGARLWVITDNDPAKAQQIAAHLGRKIYDLRDITRTDCIGIDAAIDRALPMNGAPVILADVADNAGGGAPGDSTFILERLVERGIRDVATGCYFDPVAVDMCRNAEVGARFSLRIGGKCGPTSGMPLDLHVTVRGMSDDHWQTGLSGDRVPFGPAAWVEAEGIDIVLVSYRCQVFAPDAFTNLGLDPTARRLVVVKSTQHFYARFAPLSSNILYVSTPGALAPDFAAIPYTKRDKNYWPKVADPLAVSEESEVP